MAQKRRFYDPIKNDLKFCSPFSSTKKGRSRRIWRRYNEQSSSSSLQSDDQVESGWIEDCSWFDLNFYFCEKFKPLTKALEATRIYGFSKYRGARENSLKVVVTLTTHQPKMQVIETALKLRKQYGTMIYALAIDIDHLANLIDFTGSSDRVISGRDRQIFIVVV